MWIFSQLQFIASIDRRQGRTTSPFPTTMEQPAIQAISTEPFLLLPASDYSGEEGGRSMKQDVNSQAIVLSDFFSKEGRGRTTNRHRIQQEQMTALSSSIYDSEGFVITSFSQLHSWSQLFQMKWLLVGLIVGLTTQWLFVTTVLLRNNGAGVYSPNLDTKHSVLVLACHPAATYFAISSWRILRPKQSKPFNLIFTFKACNASVGYTIGLYLGALPVFSVILDDTTSAIVAFGINPPTTNPFLEAMPTTLALSVALCLAFHYAMLLCDDHDVETRQLLQQEDV